MSETAQPTRSVVVHCVFCDIANRVDLAKLDAGPKCGKCGRPIKLDRPLKVTDASFDQTIRNATVPVLVDFYADWCGPCRMMAPTLDDFTRDRMGNVLVLKLDTDANPTTASRFAIRGVPTLIMMHNGAEKARHVGMADRKILDKLVA